MSNGNIKAAMAASLKTADKLSNLRGEAHGFLVGEEYARLELKPVAPDGKCLFSAISLELFGTVEKNDILRRLAMDEIRQSGGVGYDLEGLTLDAYLVKYGNPAEYGGRNEIEALSKILDRKFEVFQKQHGDDEVTRETIGDSTVDGHPYILLWYYGYQGANVSESSKHYDALQFKQDPTLYASGTPPITYPLESGIDLTDATTLEEAKQMFSTSASNTGSAISVNRNSSATRSAISVNRNSSATRSAISVDGNSSSTRSAISLNWDGSATGSAISVDGNRSATDEDTNLALVTSLFLLSSTTASSARPQTGPSVLGRFGKAVTGVAGSAGRGIAGAASAIGTRMVGAFATKTPQPRGPRIPPPLGPRNPTLMPTVKVDLQYLMTRPTSSPVTTSTVTKDDSLAKAGDIVGVYVTWGDKLLIYKKADGTVGVPTREVADGQTSFKAVGLSVVQDEINLKKPLEEDDLVEFKRIKDGDKTMVYYYVEFGYKPDLLGPDESSKADMDLTFDFISMGLKGEISGPAPPPADATIPPPATKPRIGLFWASIGALRIWLVNDKNKAYRDTKLLNNLRALAKALNIKTGVDEDDLREMPKWSNGLFDPKDIKPRCKASDFVTSDCLPKTVRKDIYIADEFSQENRLVKRIDDPALLEYQRLVKQLEEEKGSTNDSVKIAQLAMKLYHGYPDRHVYIRDPVTNQIHRRIVPNPYRAVSYREDEVTEFGNPNGISAADKDGVMLKRNIQLLKEVAPAQIIADKAMSIAILESLWFCGQNPTISNDPRCFPARLLGELREYQADKVQMSQDVEAKAVLENSEWPWLKIMLADLKATIAGAQTYAFTQDIIPRKVIKKQPLKAPPSDATTPGAATPGVTTPSAATVTDATATPGAAATVLAAVAKEAATRPPRALPAAPMATNVRIVPRQIGGGILPVLPGRRLGVLPPLVRT